MVILLDIYYTVSYHVLTSTSVYRIYVRVYHINRENSTNPVAPIYSPMPLPISPMPIAMGISQTSDHDTGCLRSLAKYISLPINPSALLRTAANQSKSGG